MRPVIDARPADQARQDAVLLVHHPKICTFPGGAPRTAENRTPPQSRSGVSPANSPQEPCRFLASGAKARSFACSYPRGAQVRSYGPFVVPGAACADASHPSRDLRVLARACVPACAAPAALSDDPWPRIPSVTTRQASGRGLGVSAGDGLLPGDANGAGATVPFILGHRWDATAARTPVPPPYVVRQDLPAVATDKASSWGFVVRINDRSRPLDAHACRPPVPLLLV
jgi:hypothetical protein